MRNMSFAKGYAIGVIVSLIVATILFATIFTNSGQIVINKNYGAELAQCKSDLKAITETRSCTCDCKSPLYETMLFWVAGFAFLGYALYIKNKAEDTLAEIKSKRK